MVGLLPEVRPDVFVRRDQNFTGNKKNSSGQFQTSRLAGVFLPSVDLSEGARSALYGSNRALELAKDFNTSRLGRPARRRLGEFFRGFSSDLGASARDINRTAERIQALTQDLDSRFGELAGRIFGRLDSGLSGGFRSTEFSLSQVNFSLQVENTLLSIVKDGEKSLLRLDQVQLSINAVQIEGGVTVRDGIGFSPKTPLFELPAGQTTSQIVDRLIKAFGPSSVTTQVETQEIKVDLATTVFTASIAGAAGEADGAPPAAEPDGGIDVVA